VQQGIASKLDYQAIVDLVGDRLREVLSTGDVNIRRFDPKTGLMHYLYIFEHGKRLYVEPQRPRAGGIWEKMLANREPIVLGSLNAMGITGGAVPGTDLAKSFAAIPIVASDRLIGLVMAESFEREDAFGPSEVRLVQTIAASLGTALENARLFDETQRLLKESERASSAPPSSR
jgi:GAF domain-containing protein